MDLVHEVWDVVHEDYRVFVGFDSFGDDWDVVEVDVVRWFVEDEEVGFLEDEVCEVE
ncbi:MAG: hypothetical protein ABIK13_01310 [Patescibacteria group bacterium]